MVFVTKLKLVLIILYYCQVLKKLKDIPFKIQTASLKGRRDVLKEIENVLSTPGKFVNVSYILVI